MTRYVHTNIIAKDCEKLIQFYKDVFACKSIGEKRDLKGPSFDKLTGIPDVHITGEHLVMPGYDDRHPTLEIFSYNQMEGSLTHPINAYGIGHLAFEVDDVAETLEKLLAHGGGTIGELIHADYENGRRLTAVYATDIEGNIVEILSWAKGEAK